MHEMSLTQSILDIAIEHAKANNAKKILLINIKSGRMMAIVDDAMQFAFEYLKKGTIAEEAILIIEHVPIVVECLECNSKSQTEKHEILTCPKCGAHFVKILTGKEFYVDSIEIE